MSQQSQETSPLSLAALVDAFVEASGTMATISLDSLATFPRAVLQSLLASSFVLKKTTIKMRYTEMLALAMGNLAAAQFSTSQFTNSSTTMPTSTDGGSMTGSATTESSTSTTSSALDNQDVSTFNFLGCVSSGNGFPTFSLAYDSEENDPERCADACEGSNFFGLYSNTCYCGAALDLTQATIENAGSCDIPCPGDESAACGGLTVPSRLLRRQNVDLSVLLTIFINAGVTVDDTTVTVTDLVTETLAPVTTTFTTTSFGDSTTVVATVTTVVAAIPTDVVIVCYGNFCAPKYQCPTCTNYQIVCSDGHCAPRQSNDENWDKLVICDSGLCHYADFQGEDCNQHISCYGSECTWDREHKDEYKKKFICTADDQYYFEECNGDCYEYHTCNGDSCDVVSPPAKSNIPPPAQVTPGTPVVHPGCEGAHCSPEKPMVPGQPMTP
ncbi:hypothetical protein FZEAL_1007, partial [Fusarium zealandicum]